MDISKLLSVTESAVDMSYVENSSTQAFTNVTGTPSIVETPMAVVHMFYAFRVLVSAITMVGNGLVVICFVKYRAVRTTSNYFLVSLAFADVASGPAVLLSLLINIVNEFEINWSAHIMCVIAVSMNAMALAGSAFSLMGVACERYIKVNYSLRYGH